MVKKLEEMTKDELTQFAVRYVEVGDVDLPDNKMDTLLTVSNAYIAQLPDDED